MDEKTIARFWSKVDKDGPVLRAELGPCWMWTAARSTFGYGKLSVGPARSRKLKDAHRLSWEMAHGPIRGGLWVLHKCDNPGCVRPGHLFLGTHGDNMVDMRRKGRSNRPNGERARSAKLTAEQVLLIRAEHDPNWHSGRGCKALAKRYGVGANAIHCIVHRKTWQHI